MTGQMRLRRVAALPAAVALAGGLLAALWLLLTPRVALAGGVVNTCNETGLRQAMAGGGLVTFNCGAPVTITLASQIVVTQDTTLDGGALGLVTLRGGGVTRFITTTTGVTLRLYHLTLYEGHAEPDGGGALHLAGPAIISDSVFFQNSADFSGAIETNAPLTIAHSTFDYNQGLIYGGALATVADLYITDSIFHDNESGLGLAGAIVVQGRLWVTNSTFYSNTADTSGGAISNYYLGHISGSTFYNNHADSEGGAIHNIGVLWVTDSDIYSNTTFGKGAGLINKLTLYLSDSRVHHNGASDEGGGVQSEGALEVTGSAIYNNLALKGGGVAAYGLVTMTDTSLYDNLSNQSGGGALLGISSVNEDHILLSRVDIYGNTVTGGYGIGGGLHLEGGGLDALLTEVKIHDNQILSSTQVAGGGGLAVDFYGQVTLLNSAVYQNDVPYGSGGGIFATDAPTLTLINTGVYSNTASPGGVGGGIYAQYIGIAGSTNLVLSNTTVSGNFANSGAGVYSDPGNDPAQINSATLFANIGVAGINLYGPAQLHGTVIGGRILALPCASDAQVLCGAIASGPVDQNCVGTITSLGYNLDDDASCHLTGTGDLSDTVAYLLPLRWNGGFSLTHAPVPESFVIDAGDPGNCPATDQRGGARPVDGDGVGGARCDIGALEFKAVVAQVRLPAIFR